jgi:hypothetical protein
MTAVTLSELLIEAPARRHFAQLYRDLDPLGRAVSTFIETGLQRGNALLVTATSTNTDVILGTLKNSGVDPLACRRTGQLTVIDADAMLGRFMRGDLPDWNDFRSAMGAVLEEVQHFGGAAIRAFGEMVNLLWRDGLVPAAIQLEKYLNALSEEFSLSRYCAYLLDSKEREPSALHDVCCEHSDVILTETGQLGSVPELQNEPALQDMSDEIRTDPIGVAVGKLVPMTRTAEGESECKETMLWLMRDEPVGRLEG